MVGELEDISVVFGALGCVVVAGKQHMMNCFGGVGAVWTGCGSRRKFVGVEFGVSRPQTEELYREVSCSKLCWLKFGVKVRS